MDDMGLEGSLFLLICLFYSQSDLFDLFVNIYPC